MASIVVDSGTDFSDKYKGKATVVPFKIVIDGKEYRDKEEISLKQVLELHDGTRNLSTSQPSVKAFLDVFKTLPEPIFYISASSKLSGTFSTGVVAARMSGKQVYCFDSLSLIAGSALLAEYAVDNKDKEPAELIKELEKLRERVRVFVVAKDLKRLSQSGRMPPIGGKLGDMLDVKLIFQIVDGKLKLYKTVRHYDNAVNKLAEMVKGRDARVLHIESKKEAEKIAGNAKNAIVQDNICTALGVHLGPGVAVVFLD